VDARAEADRGDESQEEPPSRGPIDESIAALADRVSRMGEIEAKGLEDAVERPDDPHDAG